MSIRYEKDNTVYYIHNDNTDLPVIVMVHGFRGTHHGLDLIAGHLDNYRIIVPDIPGFGETAPLESIHSIDNYVEWLHSFMIELNLSKPPLLLGHSFGSIIVSDFASKYPELIEKLILVNPIGSPALQGPRSIMTRLALLYYWFGRKLPEKPATKLLSLKPIVMIMTNAMTKTKDKKIKRYIHDQHFSHFSSFTNNKIVSETFSASVSNTVRDFAHKISTPTLLIAGDIDDITPIEKQYELLKMFKNAKIEVINNVGHLTHYETPELVAKSIIDFTS